MTTEKSRLFDQFWDFTLKRLPPKFVIYALNSTWKLFGTKLDCKKEAISS